ncbi:MAG TPA: hypothetical protein VK543_07605 [Puia sp.]|nr:hypothetical protein [Puia sp.]
MKKILLILFLGLLIAGTGHAQCGKKITWTASKAEFMDDSGKVAETKDTKVIIRTSGQRIHITHGDDETDTLSGPVKDVQCSWKEAYKNGKTTFKADLSERNGTYSGSVLVIEARDSKIQIDLSFEGPDGSKKHIRIPVEGYKEEK